MSSDPDPEGTTLLFLALSLLLLASSALYAAAGSVLAHLSAAQVRKEAEAGDPAARKLRMAMELEIGGVHTPRSQIIVCAVLGAAAWALALRSPLLGLLSPVPAALLRELLAWLIASLCYAFLFGVLGFLLPRRAVLRAPEAFARRHAGLIWWLTRSGSLPLTLHNAAVYGLLRLMRIDPRSLEEDITEKEILQVVDEAEENDVIEETEKDMINNILDFNDTTAGETMTHRTDIIAVPVHATVEQVAQVSLQEGTSRIPVYEEDIDNVVGICYVKDLLPYVGRGVPEDVRLSGLMRPAYFVPETKKCSQLFREMTERKLQIAIVVDEYGGTAGLVTLEDLVESIVGNIQDEYDREEDDSRQLSERAFTVDGNSTLDEVADLTGVELPEGDYDTVAGLVTEQLGRIPKPGEHPKISVGGLSITVLSVEDQRLSRLLLVKEEPAPEQNKEEQT